MKKLFKQIIWVMVLALGLVSQASAALQEGKDYEVLSRPLQQIQKDKIEVAEFFGYFCVHCYRLNPVLFKYAKSWASDTYLRPIHVVWSDDMMGLAKVAAAVNASGLKYQADSAVFEAVYVQKLNLSDANTFKQWASKQTAFDGKKLILAYQSVTNQSQAKQMANLTEQLQIEGTPTIIVGGKYRMNLTGDWNVDMKHVNEMIQRVRQERGLKAPEIQRSRGGVIAKSANQ